MLNLHDTCLADVGSVDTARTAWQAGHRFNVIVCLSHGPLSSLAITCYHDFRGEAQLYVSMFADAQPSTIRLMPDRQHFRKLQRV